MLATGSTPSCDQNHHHSIIRRDTMEFPPTGPINPGDNQMAMLCISENTLLSIFKYIKLSTLITPELPTSVTLGLYTSGSVHPLLPNLCQPMGPSDPPVDISETRTDTLYIGLDILHIVVYRIYREGRMLTRFLLSVGAKLGFDVSSTQEPNSGRVSLPLSKKPDNLSDELVLLLKRPRGFPQLRGNSG